MHRCGRSRGAVVSNAKPNSSLEKIHQAYRILGERGVDFAFDGELQADAALVPEVAKVKAPGRRL